MEQKGIHDQKLTVTHFKNLPVFYQVEESSLPFDPFSASFYLVSRYEEYDSKELDHYDRFQAQNSLAFQHDFLQIPVVNSYAGLVAEVLTQQFPKLQITHPTYRFQPTYDVDSAFAYKHKGLFRNAGGLMRSLSKLNTKEAGDRLKVLLNQEIDPFDSYSYLEELHNNHRVKPIFFFLLGDYDEYDKNIAHNVHGYRQLIRSVADFAHVGIHPSFASGENPSKLKLEIDRLEEILNRPVKKSRQHFLRLSMPESYRKLQELGITDDYTMGYASQTGFRASICNSFMFYDLEREIKTDLRIHPFAVMDATLVYYQHKTPKQSLEIMEPLISQTKRFGGTFSTLWHNSSFCEKDEWVGWKASYESIFELALP